MRNLILIISLILSTSLPFTINSASTPEKIYITVTEPGTLAQVMEAQLGEDWRKVVDLTISGPLYKVDLDDLLLNGYCWGLKYLNMENATLPDNELPDLAFWNPDDRFHVAFEEVTLPKNLIRIGELSLYHATVMKYVHLPSTLKIIDKMAFDYNWLLRMPSFNEGLEIIEERAFYTSLGGTILNCPTTLKKIGNKAFGELVNGFQEINFNANLEELGDSAFYHNSNVSHLNLPWIKKMGNYCFYWMTDLQSVTLAEGFTELPTGTFKKCQKLTSVNFPTTLKTIGSSAFEDDSSYKEVIFNDGLEDIRSSAFRNSGVERIVIPETLKKIESFAFYDLSNLKEIYCKSETPPTIYDVVNNLEPSLAFGGTTPKEAIVYVPVGSAETYRTTLGWDYFTNIVEYNPQGGVDGITSENTNVIRKGGEIVVYTDKPERYTIFTPEGRLVSTGTSDGETRITTNKGLYIVKVGNKSFKIM